MNQETIFIPFFGMMLLTISVWFYMYYWRLSYIVRNRIDPQSLATSSDTRGIMPARINSQSENLVNLFELPVLFYAACLYLYVTHHVDTVYIVLGNGFLAFRIAHSVIHCTYNNVMHRFYFYILSAICLWILIARAFVGIVAF
jgi:hypothetical protein